MMAAVNDKSDKLNFRCRPRLRSVLEEEERRSGVTISDQIRITLEKAYEVDEEPDWLPPVLRKKASSPTSATPAKDS